MVGHTGYCCNCQTLFGSRDFVALRVRFTIMARIKPQALLQQSKKKKGPSHISVNTVVLYSLIVVVMGFFLYATYRHWAHRFVGIFAVG